MKSVFLLLVSGSLVSFLFCGCQQQDKYADKRAKLGGHLTHQLKIQTQEKDNQIEALTKQLQDCQAQSAKSDKAANDCMTSQGNEFMEMITPIMDELEVVKKENQELKDKLSKFDPNN